MLLPVFYKPIVFPGVNRAKSFLNFDFNFDFFFFLPISIISDAQLYCCESAGTTWLLAARLPARTHDVPEQNNRSELLTLQG